MTLFRQLVQIAYLMNALLWISTGYGVFVTFNDYLFSTLFVLAGVFVFPPVLKFITRMIQRRFDFIEPVHLYAALTNVAIVLVITMGMTYGTGA